MPQGILKNFARSKEIPNFVDITPRPIFWPCLNDTLKTKSTRHPPRVRVVFFNFFLLRLPQNSLYLRRGNYDTRHFTFIHPPKRISP